MAVQLEPGGQGGGTSWPQRRQIGTVAVWSTWWAQGATSTWTSRRTGPQAQQRSTQGAQIAEHPGQRHPVAG
jgi:hypothetical protein